MGVGLLHCWLNRGLSFGFVGAAAPTPSAWEIPLGVSSERELFVALELEKKRRSFPLCRAPSRCSYVLDVGWLELTLEPEVCV